MTVFVGCGFAAKYPEGGGVFSVPLQYMLGLRRLGLDAIWLEILPVIDDKEVQARRINAFQKQLHEYGLEKNFCLLCQNSSSDVHEIDDMRCFGISRRELRERLSGPNTLLNLAYSIHPPFLMEFERRILCDLDPSEVFYWMTKMEMGQSHHHEFCTIGLNVHGDDCRLPKSPVKWRTFFPLIDTKFARQRQRPREAPAKFTTIGQWYWGGRVEVNGEFPDLSKKMAFEPYLDLPKRVSAARFELAMNLNADDPEILRLHQHGWQVVSPHQVAETPRAYLEYVAGATAEFTAIKGVDVAWRTGWVSDRAATFLALGRPVITEDTGAQKYLPSASGFRFVAGLEEAIAAANEILRDWERMSREARSCAVEMFDSVRNLKVVLDLP